MTTENPGSPPEESATRLPFYRALIDECKAALQPAFLHPELRSVLVVLDYGGELNAAHLTKAFWLCEGNKRAGLYGVMSNAFSALHELSEQAAGITAAEGQELLKARKEYEQLQHTSTATDIGIKREELLARIAGLLNITKPDDLVAAVQGLLADVSYILPADATKKWPDFIYRDFDGNISFGSPSKVSPGRFTADYLRAAGYEPETHGPATDGWETWRRKAKPAQPAAPVAEPDVKTFPDVLTRDTNGVIWHDGKKLGNVSEYALIAGGYVRTKTVGTVTAWQKLKAKPGAGAYAAYPQRIWIDERKDHTNTVRDDKGDVIGIDVDLFAINDNFHRDPDIDKPDRGKCWVRNPPAAGTAPGD